MKVMLWIMLLFFTACQNPQSQSPAARLKEELQSFHIDMRWQRYEQASQYFAVKNREAFLEYYQPLRDRFHITEFEIREVKYEDQGKTAKVRVLLKWYTLPSTQLKKGELLEEWHYDSRTRQWILNAQLLNPL